MLKESSYFYHHLNLRSTRRVPQPLQRRCKAALDPRGKYWFEKLGRQVRCSVSKLKTGCGNCIKSEDKIQSPVQSV